MASILDEFLILFKPTVKGNGFQQLNKQMKQTHQNLFSMKNLFSAFIGFDIYSGVKQFAGSMVQASKDLGAMRSRFYAITGDMDKANEQLQWSFDLAKKTAMPMKALADSYSIFYAATQKGLGDTGAQQVFQDWTEVSRVLHMSEYQFERVTYALREMASKGVVYSQDLRMQIGTHVPNAIGLAEKAVNDLGITGTDWFEKFQKQSKGNQKMINQFLLLFSKYAKEQFADPEAVKKAMQMPDAQIQRLLNQGKAIQFAMVDSGFQDDLLKVLFKVNNLLDKITSHSRELYGVLKDVAKLVLVIFAWKALAPLMRGIRIVFIVFKRLFSGKIFKALLRLGAKGAFSFGLKGILAFIPYIGQIALILWTIWDVLKLVWDFLKIKFPGQTRAIKWQILEGWNKIVTFMMPTFEDIKVILGAIGTIIKGIWNIILKPLFSWLWNIIKFLFKWVIRPILVGIGALIYGLIIFPIQMAIKLIAWIIKALPIAGNAIANWWNGLKNKNNGGFPGVTPDTNSWDYVQKQNMLPLSNYAGGTQYNFNPTISYENNINADGLSQEEASKLIAESNNQNNKNLMSLFGKGIGGSKNKT